MPDLRHQDRVDDWSFGRLSLLWLTLYTLVFGLLWIPFGGWLLGWCLGVLGTPLWVVAAVLDNHLFRARL